MPARGPPVFGKSSRDQAVCVADGALGWEPIFEHNGETLAEMEHDKKVGDVET